MWRVSISNSPTLKRTQTWLLVVGIVCGAGITLAQDQGSDRTAGKKDSGTAHEVTITVTVPDSTHGAISPTPDRRRFQANWKKLKRGMNYEEVERLLGKPSKVASSHLDASTTWYYGTRIVVFDNIKRTTRFWEK